MLFLIAPFPSLCLQISYINFIKGIDLCRELISDSGAYHLQPMFISHAYWPYLMSLSIYILTKLKLLDLLKSYAKNRNM